MADLNGFNAHDVEPTASFEPVPAGKYVAAITESEMKATKNGNGSFLELQLSILEGEHTGRVLWARLNLNNPNETAVKIAKGELSRICRAVGVMTPHDSSELHGIPMVVTVALKKRNDTGGYANEIKGYEARASATASRPPQRQAPAPAGNNSPPWKR